MQDGFDDSEQWSKASGDYFRREHKEKGEGRKGLIYNSLVDKKAVTTFQMSPSEIDYHYHLASMFNNISQASSHDVTSMARHIVKEGVVEKTAEIALLRKCLSEACEEVFADLASNKGCNILNTMMEEVNKRTDEKNMERQNEIPRSETNHPTDYNTVRKKYTEGSNSILKNLPIPDVEELDGFGYIPVEKILNNILAMGIDMLTFEKDDDYTDCNGNYEGTYFRDLHQTVKEANHPENTKVHILRAWSDAFEAHQIVADTEHNSMQLFTITVLPPKGCSRSGMKHLTFPFALGYKKKDHTSAILDCLMEEINSMKIVKERYCGKAKRLVKTAFYFQTCSNDYPERCANSVTSQLGTYTHRWGYSCLFDHSTSPSCNRCRQDRVHTILENSHESSNVYTNCPQCTDWWSYSESLDIYPTEAGEEEVKPVPLVKLSFQILSKAVESVVAYKEDGAKPTKTAASAHLSRCGVGAKFGKYVVDLIWDSKIVGTNFIEHLPVIWRKHNLYGIDVEDFALAPMHMCSLGVEKTLIPQTMKMFNKSVKLENYVFKELVNKMYAYQGSINNLSLDWCKVMPFSSKDQSKLGTASWQSEHYLSFTRLSLLHFGKLNHLPVLMQLDEKRVKIFKAFKCVRVLWFCLMSRMFGDAKVSSKEVDNYVKLFLSSCNSLHNALEEVKFSESEEKKNKKNKTKKRKRSDDNCDNENDNENDQSAIENENQRASTHAADNNDDETASKNKKQGPFFTTGSNFLSLLNVRDTIDRYGSMRALWEGLMEGFIQNVKCELTNMRHNYTFMQTILKKMLRASYLEQMNEDNPFSHNKKYSRTLNCKVYPTKTNVGQTMFDSDSVISGVIIAEKMYICFGDTGTIDSNITLRPIHFDHSIGIWRYNLWYASPNISDCDNGNISCSNRVELVELATDYFIVAPILALDPGDNEAALFIDKHWAYTVICRSWRVMVNNGTLTYSIPLSELFSE